MSMSRAHEVLMRMNRDAVEYGQILRAVKFDLGEFSTLESMASLSSGEFFRAPFPVCTFEAAFDGACFLFLTVQTDEQLHITAFYKNIGSSFQWDHASIHLWISPSGELDFRRRDGTEITEAVMADPKSLAFASLLRDMALCLEVFSCSNVTHIEHKAPKFINQKREKKGLPPIFEYRTLHITGETAAPSESRGGAHASPRLHLRRGHIRRLGDGRRVWVRSAIVGSRDSGFVDKAYEVQARRPA